MTNITTNITNNTPSYNLIGHILLKPFLGIIHNLVHPIYSIFIPLWKTNLLLAMIFLFLFFIVISKKSKSRCQQHDKYKPQQQTKIINFQKNKKDLKRICNDLYIFWSYMK